MELVKSYDSDVEDSVTEEIKLTSNMSSKEIDVIDLDSDSDDEFTVQKNSIKESHTKVLSDSAKNIDCIELDDGESPIKDSNKDIGFKKTLEVSVETTEKKIDYLNLEDSESDMECEISKNSTSNLMDDACNLSEVPVGPMKLNELSESRSNTETISYAKELDEVSISNINGDDIDYLKRDTDFLHYNSSGDGTVNMISEPSGNFKSGNVSLTNDASGLLSTKNEITSNLYRDDDRIIKEKSNILCRIPHQVIKTHIAHSNVITSLNWCIAKFSYLFLSSSLDGSIKIWDLFQKNYVQCIKSDYGFCACKWSIDGGQIYAGGKAKKACVFDVESAKKIVEYDIYNIVTSIEAHPYMEDVFLCGTRNAILGFDVRVNTTLPIRSYFSKCEEVLDIAFIDDNEFLCSTNIVSQDSADRTIMAWHFSSGAKLSNQIYLERFTCPSLRVNPSDMSFIAQSNGNYIASFSATRPYTRRNKRYMGHSVAGYGIECDISPDGKYVISGDAEGRVYFYNYSNTNVVRKTSQQKVPVNRVKWHPTYYSTVITATYDGQISVWE